MAAEGQDYLFQLLRPDFSKQVYTIVWDKRKIEIAITIT